MLIFMNICIFNYEFKIYIKASGPVRYKRKIHGDERSFCFVLFFSWGFGGQSHHVPHIFWNSVCTGLKLKIIVPNQLRDLNCSRTPQFPNRIYIFYSKQMAISCFLLARVHLPWYVQI